MEITTVKGCDYVTERNLLLIQCDALYILMGYCASLPDPILAMDHVFQASLGLTGLYSSRLSA